MITTDGSGGVAVVAVVAGIVTVIDDIAIVTTDGSGGVAGISGGLAGVSGGVTVVGG